MERDVSISRCLLTQKESRVHLIGCGGGEGGGTGLRGGGPSRPPTRQAFSLAVHAHWASIHPLPTSPPPPAWPPTIRLSLIVPVLLKGHINEMDFYFFIINQCGTLNCCSLFDFTIRSQQCGQYPTPRIVDTGSRRLRVALIRGGTFWIFFICSREQ